MSYLGTAADYGILSENLVEFSSGTTTINGYFGSGVTPNGSYTATRTDINNSNYTNAISQAQSAYTTLSGMTVSGTITGGNLNDQTLGPGVYNSSIGTFTFGDIVNPETLTLNGGPSSTFIFIATGAQNAVNFSFQGTPDSVITLTGGATYNNVYWVSPGKVNIELVNFYGNILAEGNINYLGAGTTSNGSVISLDTTDSPAITISSSTTINSASSACLHPNTIIKTKRGNIPIKEIHSGDFVIDQFGNPIEVLYNIKLAPMNNWVKISKNALGNNIPENDLYITHQHPIIVNNKYIYPVNLINNDTIYEIILPPENMYSICTDNQYFALAEGMNVSTWRESDFENTRIYQNGEYEKI